MTDDGVQEIHRILDGIVAQVEALRDRLPASLSAGMAEAEHLLRCSRKTILKLIRENPGIASRVGADGRWSIDITRARAAMRR